MEESHKTKIFSYIGLAINAALIMFFLVLDVDFEIRDLHESRVGELVRDIYYEMGVYTSSKLDQYTDLTCLPLLAVFLFLGWRSRHLTGRLAEKAFSAALSLHRKV